MHADVSIKNVKANILKIFVKIPLNFISARWEQVTKTIENS